MNKIFKLHNLERFQKQLDKIIENNEEINLIFFNYIIDNKINIFCEDVENFEFFLKIIRKNTKNLSIIEMQNTVNLIKFLLKENIKNVLHSTEKFKIFKQELNEIIENEEIDKIFSQYIKDNKIDIFSKNSEQLQFFLQILIKNEEDLNIIEKIKTILKEEKEKINKFKMRQFNTNALNEIYIIRNHKVFKEEFFNIILEICTKVNNLDFVDNSLNENYIYDNDINILLFILNNEIKSENLDSENKNIIEQSIGKLETIKANKKNFEVL